MAFFTPSAHSVINAIANGDPNRVNKLKKFMEKEPLELFEYVEFRDRVKGFSEWVLFLEDDQSIDTMVALAHEKLSQRKFNNFINEFSNYPRHTIKMITHLSDLSGLNYGTLFNILTYHSLSQDGRLQIIKQMMNHHSIAELAEIAISRIPPSEPLTHVIAVIDCFKDASKLSDQVLNSIAHHSKALEIFQHYYPEAKSLQSRDHDMQGKILSALIAKAQTPEALSILQPYFQFHCHISEQFTEAVFKGDNTEAILDFLAKENKKLFLSHGLVTTLCQSLTLTKVKNFYTYAATDEYKDLIKANLLERFTQNFSPDVPVLLKDLNFDKKDVFQFMLTSLEKQPSKSYFTGSVEEHMKMGFDLNFQNNYGQTLLMLALKKREYTAAEALISIYKADLFIQDAEGRSAIDYVPDDHSNFKVKLKRYYDEAKPDTIILPKKPISSSLSREDIFLFETGERIVRIIDEQNKSSSHSIQSFAEVPFEVLEQVFNMHAKRGGNKKFADYGISGPKHKISHLVDRGAV